MRVLRGLELVLVFSTAMICIACTNATFDALGQSMADPFVKAPEAESFRLENIVTLRWDEDPGAEEYVLERSGDQAVPDFRTVYRGTQLVFTDYADNTRYLYRLTKTRGDRFFGPSLSVLGVGASARRDAYEPNDTEMSSVAMGTFVEANTFFYRSSTGEELSDKDWYTISVPARARASILIEQNLPLGSPLTYLYFYRIGGVPEPVTNGDPVVIENTGYTAMTYSFSLYPYSDNYVGGGGVGGMMKSYSIRLLQITWL